MSKDDAEQDAAMILLKMRDKWQNERSAHVPAERQEQVVINWARLQLIDHYESDFRYCRRNVSMNIPIGGAKNRILDSSQCATDQTLEDELALTKRPGLSGLDAEEIRSLVERLPERPRTVVKLLVFEGKYQKEVAESMGITQPAVSAHFAKACELLRTLLADFR